MSAPRDERAGEAGSIEISIAAQTLRLPADDSPVTLTGSPMGAGAEAAKDQPSGVDSIHELTCDAVFAASAMRLHASPSRLDPALRERLLAGAPIRSRDGSSVSVGEQRGATGRMLRVTGSALGPAKGSSFFRGVLAGALAGGGLAAAAGVLIATGLGFGLFGRSPSAVPVPGAVAGAGVAGAGLGGAAGGGSAGGDPLVAQPTRQPPLAAVLAALERAPDAEQLVFSPGEGDLAGVTGTVNWSDSLQAGTLTFTGLPPNDRSKMQYQLWIVDPSRDAKPVDGGVFDVEGFAQSGGPASAPNLASGACAGDGTVVVAVTARLPVRKPAAFAITREKPGGVVVSAGPLVLVAARPTR